WTLLADVPGREVKLVILEHDDRLFDTLLTGGEDFVGEHLVDGYVAVVPGIPDFDIDIRSAGCLPQIVLQEPEQRVADDVVVLVIGIRIGRDKAEHEIAALAARRDQLLAIAASHLGPNAVAISHRGSDPDRFNVFGNRGNR